MSDLFEVVRDERGRVSRVEINLWPVVLPVVIVILLAQCAAT